jgi:hypothetical protein
MLSKHERTILKPTLYARYVWSELFRSVSTPHSGGSRREFNTCQHLFSGAII